MAEPPHSPFDELLGTEVREAGPDRVVAELSVTPQLHQPAGIVHGGVYCALVELVASVGASLWLQANGDPDSRAVGIANHTDFLRAVSEGTLAAVGTPYHRGSKLQLWQVDIRDERDRPVARGDVRLMNLPG